MNDMLHLVTVYEVLIYCQTIEAVVGYWSMRSGNMPLCIPRYLTTESRRIFFIQNPDDSVIAWHQRCHVML